MASKIQIYGLGWKEVDTVRARTLDIMLKDKSIPRSQKIDIQLLNGGSYNGTIGKIESVSIEEDNRRDNGQYVDDVNKDYREKRKKFFLLTLEQKASNINMFELLWWGATGQKEVPESVKIEVIAIQSEFFRDNTKRTLCSPHLLVKLLPQSGTVALMYATALKVIERAVQEDMYQEKYS